MQTEKNCNCKLDLCPFVSLFLALRASYDHMMMCIVRRTTKEKNVKSVTAEKKLNLRQESFVSIFSPLRT